MLFFREFPLSRSSKHHDAQKRLGRRRRRKKNGAIAFKLSSISSPRAVLSRRRGGLTFASGRKRPELRAFFSWFLDGGLDVFRRKIFYKVREKTCTCGRRRAARRRVLRSSSIFTSRGCFSRRTRPRGERNAVARLVFFSFVFQSRVLTRRVSLSFLHHCEKTAIAKDL